MVLYIDIYFLPGSFLRSQGSLAAKAGLASLLCCLAARADCNGLHGVVGFDGDANGSSLIDPRLEFMASGRKET